jgi:hypothetical protein
MGQGPKEEKPHNNNTTTEKEIECQVTDENRKINKIQKMDESLTLNEYCWAGDRCGELFHRKMMRSCCCQSSLMELHPIRRERRAKR